MSEICDSIYYAQLAKAARRLAASHQDGMVRRRLRETAIQHDRMARALARKEQADKGKKRGISGWLSKQKS